MKFKIFASLILVSILIFTFLNLSIFGQVTSTLNDSFDYYNSSVWEKSDGWTNGNPFNCTWRANNVSFSNGQLRLALTNDTASSNPPYAGAEYRTKEFFSYGRYEVTMKPAKNTGIVSSFFTYTGPSDDNPWDEIDIEFLGKDTTKVQFNYFTNGQGNHEYFYNLGFDASTSFHTYAFEWQPNYIAWFVDGKEVHRATSNIPKTPGKIMMNLWPGIGVDDWLGSYNGVNPLYAYYDSVKYSTGSVTTPSPTTTPSTGKCGDVNSSGNVDITDALLIAQYYVGKNPANFNRTLADVNKDGSINIQDALLVSQYYVGIINNLSCN